MPDEFGNALRFRVVSVRPPRVLLGGPYRDEAIAQELYNDARVRVVHARHDYSVIEVDLGYLHPQWQSHFHRGASSPSNGVVIALGGFELARLGDVANLMRELYNRGIASIHQSALDMLRSGRSEEAVARWVVEQRNQLKLTIRRQGPALFRILAETRNRLRYGNPLGPTYERLAARHTNSQIINGVTRTSRGFNAAGRGLRVVGGVGTAVGVVFQATQNSPAASTPLPATDQEQVEIERVRLRYRIPADANIDRHGHLKPSYYLQVDVFDPHIGSEFDSETEEILWYFGLPITYQWRGVRWTVPGREW